MAVAELRGVSVAYRGPALLDDVSCQLEAGQRIGLLGRNGAGKTTLMRMLTGEVLPDHGDVVIAAGAKVALLAQDVPHHLEGTIAQVVATSLAAHEPELEEWTAQPRVDKLLTRMGLDGSLRVETQSSGMKRRVLLAQTLVAEPDLLLLDEPTNHLDIDAITWLEDLLLGWPTILLFVTHDRAFLRRLATRILEIDRGRIFDWSCDYDTFLLRKEQALAAEEKQNALFDKKLAEEEAWIRQGIKARRTRNEGRVRAQRQCAMSGANAANEWESRTSIFNRRKRAAPWWPRPRTYLLPTPTDRLSKISPPPSCAATRLASWGPTVRVRPHSCDCC